MQQIGYGGLGEGTKEGVQPLYTSYTDANDITLPILAILRNGSYLLYIKSLYFIAMVCCCTPDNASPTIRHKWWTQRFRHRSVPFIRIKLPTITGGSGIVI